jgi:hypothetical protein
LSRIPGKVSVDARVVLPPDVRASLAAAIDALIDFVDAVDGDPDDEANGDELEDGDVPEPHEAEGWPEAA